MSLFNFTPYEIRILLDVHCGAAISVPHDAPIFDGTMDSLAQSGLVLRHANRYTPGPHLEGLMHHVLNAPRPMPTGQRRDLTLAQAGIFTYLLDYNREHGRAPTRREIADNFGFKSQNAAHDHLEALQRKGYVQLGSGRMRAIKVIP
jgi:hypothetical protein